MSFQIDHRGPQSSWTPTFLLSPLRTNLFAKSLILRGCTALAIVGIITYYIFFFQSWGLHDVSDAVLRRPNTRAAWIETSLSTDISGKFDGPAIKSVCARKRWEHRVVFSCGRIQGGVGNVRNVILTCLRFAIEAGGDFVIPEIHLRSKDDLSVLDYGDRLGFEYMFDEKHLRTSLKKWCPDMKIYESIEKVEQEETRIDLAFLNPADLIPGRTTSFLTHEEAARWGQFFEWWLRNQEATNSKKLWSGPVPADMDSPLMDWPVDYDDRAFANNFGRLLEFREDTRRLAATVLYELSKKFELDLEPNESITGRTFFAAHLRTAKDAIKAHWTTYDVQAAQYLEQAAREHLSTIYVATGSEEDMERFAKKAWDEYQFNTTSKTELLQGDELALLQSLSWDQQALVDYLVMLKSSSFAGIEQSTFAWNIALKRHTLSSDAKYLEHGQTFHDEYSTLLGPEGYVSFAKTMWP